MNCKANSVLTSANCGAKRCKGAYGNFSSNNLDEFLNQKAPSNISNNNRPKSSNSHLEEYRTSQFQPKRLSNSFQRSTSGPNAFQQSSSGPNAFQQSSSGPNAFPQSTPGIKSDIDLDNFPDISSSHPTTSFADKIRPGFMSAENMKMTESTILTTLRSVRTPIVNYQETRGVPRTEQISFVNLMTSLCTHAYTAAITILVMLWNLAPLLDGFVYFARFTVDKLIDIFETEDQKEKIMKTAIFAGEVIIILFLIFLIIGLIFMPVYVLTARIVGKIWGMIKW